MWTTFTFSLLLFLPLSTLSHPHSNERDGEDYCLTPGCVKAAAEILQLYDQTKDPCEDFYEFACGKFIHENVIPDHKNYIGGLSKLGDVLNSKLRMLFEGEGEEGEPDIFSHVRNHYKSCMNQEAIQESGQADLLKILKELGGWPVLEGEQWKEKYFSWQKLAETGNRFGLKTGSIMKIRIESNASNATQRILTLDQPKLGISREYMIKGLQEEAVQAYFKYMVDMAVYLGAKRETAEKELKASFEFELSLASISIPQEERRNKTALNNQMSISALGDLFPGMDWENHINNIIIQESLVTESEVINIKVPSYLKKVSDLLQTVDNRVLANHMMWRFVMEMVQYLDKDALKIQLDYNKVLLGQDRQAPRWETCVKSTAGLKPTWTYFEEGSLTNAVGSMYARTFFPLAKKDIADEMVANIRAEFKLLLQELEWMDENTKINANRKADLITPHVAYDKEILDTTLINQFYEGLSLDSESYLTNQLRLNRFILQYYSKELRNPIEKQSWKTHGGAGIVNAFYSPEENSIVFPAGILDGSFFKADRPSYLNYGAIGNVVGHEITHGFDDQGSQKDGEGNLVNWWDKETKKHFLEKAQCVIDEYSSYTMMVNNETLSVNGITTQGENIADIGGYKESYRAYIRLTAKHGEEPRLPGLPFTPRQLFWMSGASGWCSVSRPARQKNKILTDPHSPDKYRINGPFRNLPEFSQDWGCKVGSFMNPVKKCTVW